MILAFLHWVMATMGQDTSWLIQFVLTTLVLAGPGRRFFLRGIPALIDGHPTGLDMKPYRSTRF